MFTPRCVAVIGTGSIGMRHLDLLRTIQGVQPIAVPTRPSRLGELDALGYATAKDLKAAAQQGARLCIVATDTGRHDSDSLAALEHGMDVLVEKPMAADAHAASRMLERAHALRRRVFVGCVLRFSESLSLFRRLLPAVGSLHSVRIECQSYLPDWRPHRAYRDSYSASVEQGGALRDLIHEIDYAGWIFGWPQALHARVKNLGRLGIAAEEVAELTWETPTGCVVSIALDYLSRSACRRMQACGSHGTIEWDGMADGVTLRAEGVATKQWRSSQTRDEMFLLQAEAFVNAACGGSKDLRLACGEDGVRALAVCDAARRSEASRREEVVALP